MIHKNWFRVGKMNHQDRLRLLRSLMDADGLEAIIALSNADHHVDWGDSVALISGVKPLGPSLSVLEKDGGTRLVVSPDWDVERARTHAHAAKVEGVSDLGAALPNLLNGLGSAKRVGVANLSGMPHGFADSLLSNLPASVVDVTTLVFNAAARKTDEELANARKATEIAERGYRHLLEVAGPGIPECRMAAEIKAITRELGADDNFMMFHAEGHPHAVQPSGERRFEAGDLILAEITPSHGGQFTQICRTACLGEATDTQHEKYELVAAAMNNGIGKAAAGAAMKEICMGIDDVLREAGYGEYCEPPYMNRRGHGLGSTSVAPGNVALNNETILEAGMFFVVHPNQYIPEVGYLLCGEPIAITDGAPDVLTEERAKLGTISI